MGINISVEGMDSVRSVLQKYAIEAKENITRGLEIGCTIIEGEAKALCPVSTEETRPGGPHGELRESITHTVSGSDGAVGTNKEYGPYVELGTYKMKAQPFLVPALKSKQGEVIKVIAEQFKG